MMRDTEVSNNAICKSIEKTVDERIQTLLERIEKNKENLKFIEQFWDKPIKNN